MKCRDCSYMNIYAILRRLKNHELEKASCIKKDKYIKINSKPCKDFKEDK